MARKVFISYRHQQAEWVRTTLYSELSAGGAEVVIDYQEFAAGLAVRRQMQAAQDKADLHLLVLTPDYFQCDYRVEEMRRAFALDPDFSKGRVLPVLLERCALPPENPQYQPLYVELTGKRQHDADDSAVAEHFRPGAFEKLCSLDFHFKEVNNRFKKLGL